MKFLVGVIGLILVFGILWEAFETIILPRRVTRRFRLAVLFYRVTWRPWRALAQSIRSAKRRDAYLSYYGPLSLPALFGLWAVGLVLGFAMLHWASGSNFNTTGQLRNFRTDLYMSGTTFFTLGLGDVTPRSALARFVTVVEGGTGFGFLAVVISYLPVLYGAFSQREMNISLLDARAGSPPSAAELLRRHVEAGSTRALVDYLRGWEAWSGQLMESHLSYPVLCFFRSQHQNQSWLAALTAVMDTCAVIVACSEGELKWQARLTFAICRHAVVDLSQVLSAPPRSPQVSRLSTDELVRLRGFLTGSGIQTCAVAEAEQRIEGLRQMYEPYVNSLAGRLLMPLPPWIIADQPADNWRTSAWRESMSMACATPGGPSRDDHF